MQKRKANNYIFYLGIALILIGSVIGLKTVFDKNKVLEEENVIVNNYINETTIVNNEEIINDNNTSNDIEIKANIERKDIGDEDILFVLEIPDIDLKKGIYYIDSKYNNVKYNVQILEGSSVPDVENGNVMLASHNGNSKVSFFKKLYKLDIGDKIYIYYNGIKYIYKLDRVYDIDKDGTAEVYRDLDKTTLTLITCKKNVKDKQEVYISYLDSTIKY